MERLGKFRGHDGEIANAGAYGNLTPGRTLIGSGRVRLPIGPPFKAALVLKCGTEFGTGGHPSTAMILRILGELYRYGAHDRVADFGCGTGIVGVVSLKLGANLVHFLDKRPSAVRLSMMNVRSNLATPRAKYHLVRGAAQIGYRAFDIVTSNLPKRAQVRNLPGLAAGLKAGGVLIISGIKTHEGGPIAAKARSLGLSLIRRDQIGSWITFAFCRPPYVRLGRRRPPPLSPLFG